MIRTKNSKFIKSEAEETNQFDVDEKLVDEIANSDEFKDVEVSTEDVLDAVQAINALAEAVIEKADAEEKKVDADTLLDEVRDMIDNSHEDEDFELEEGEELPEELVNSAVRVMVSEDGAIELEQTPDEVYNADVDGLECTVYDTCELPPIEVEDTGDTDKTEDDILVIGNSKSKNFKKGFVKLNSSKNKKAWSAAFKKVKKMIKNEKMTPAHWAIVSVLAKKEEDENKVQKKIECALVKKIRSNKALKSALIKSSSEFDDAGQPIAETKPEETVGEGNNGYKEDGDPTKAKSPETVDSTSGNPVEDPDMLVDKEDDVVLPSENIIVLEVPLTNSKRKIAFKKVYSSTRKNFVAYKAVRADENLATILNGKIMPCGKVAYMFKNTANGLLACAAKFDGGNGKLTTVITNGKVSIGKGKEYPIFNSIERFMNAKSIINARRSSMLDRKREIMSNARKERVKRMALRSRMERKNRKPVLSMAERRAKMEKMKALRSRMERKDELLNARKPNRMVASSRVNPEVIKAKMEARKAKMVANNTVRQLNQMHEAEERKRLFQSSQAVMNEERIAIKQDANKNTNALSKMYDSMF